jgi:transcriptional regulator with XRE-family HTH domain
VSKSLGDRLKELRKERGLSQKELAEELKIGRSAVGLYEINARKPDPETITLFADYFDVSTDWLLGRDIFLERGMYLKFGTRLRELREQKGITQEELGNIINQKKANISKYENGKLEPSLGTLDAIADYFGGSTDWLLGRDIFLERMKDKLPEVPGVKVKYVKFIEKYEKMGLSEERLEQLAKIITEAAEEYKTK